MANRGAEDDQGGTSIVTAARTGIDTGAARPDDFTNSAIPARSGIQGKLTLWRSEAEKMRLSAAMPAAAETPPPPVPMPPLLASVELPWYLQPKPTLFEQGGDGGDGGTEPRLDDIETAKAPPSHT